MERPGFPHHSAALRVSSTFAGMTLSLTNRAEVNAQPAAGAASSPGWVLSLARGDGRVSTNAAAGTGGRNQ